MVKGEDFSAVTRLGKKISYLSLYDYTFKIDEQQKNIERQEDQIDEMKNQMDKLSIILN